MTKGSSSDTKKGNAARESKRQLVLHKLEALAQSTTHVPEAETARAKADELKIHTEHVQVAPVIEGRSEGTIIIGYWFFEDGAVVICDSDGEPKRHRDIPTRVVPLPDQTARQVARRLIKEMHGEDPSSGFWRKLRYPSGGAPF
jgi:hypothetical protein